ncbi:MAG: hypothetical protein TYPL_4410 [Candidatus Tyloplasma litorale]|nr:MAG: hypothetical protein TYPL_4410 [Mycoplasmatales bacterium]
MYKKDNLAIISLSSLGLFANSFSEIVGVVGTFNSLTESNGNIFTKILYCPIEKLSKIEKKLLKINNIIYLEYKKNDLFKKIMKLNNARFTGILNSFHQPVEILKKKTYKTITFLENDLIINNNLELSDSKIILHGGWLKSYDKFSELDRKILSNFNIIEEKLIFTAQCIFSIPGNFYQKFLIEYEELYKWLINLNILDFSKPSSYYDHFSVIMHSISSKINLQLEKPNEENLLLYFNVFLKNNENISTEIKKFNIHRNNSGLLLKEFNFNKLIDKKYFEKRIKISIDYTNLNYLSKLSEGTIYLRNLYIYYLENPLKKTHYKKLDSKIKKFKKKSLNCLSNDLKLINDKIKEIKNQI